MKAILALIAVMVLVLALSSAALADFNAIHPSGEHRDRGHDGPRGDFRPQYFDNRGPGRNHSQTRWSVSINSGGFGFSIGNNLPHFTRDGWGNLYQLVQGPCGPQYVPVPPPQPCYQPLPQPQYIQPGCGSQQFLPNPCIGSYGYLSNGDYQQQIDQLGRLQNALQAQQNAERAWRRYQFGY